MIFIIKIVHFKHSKITGYGPSDGRTDGPTDGQTDGPTDGPMDRPTDGQTQKKKYENASNDIYTYTYSLLIIFPTISPSLVGSLFLH